MEIVHVGMATDGQRGGGRMGESSSSSSSSSMTPATCPPQSIESAMYVSSLSTSAWTLTGASFCTSAGQIRTACIHAMGGRNEGCLGVCVCVCPFDYQASSDV